MKTCYSFNVIIFNLISTFYYFNWSIKFIFIIPSHFNLFCFLWRVASCVYSLFNLVVQILGSCWHLWWYIWSRLHRACAMSLYQKLSFICMKISCHWWKINSSWKLLKYTWIYSVKFISLVSVNHLLSFLYRFILILFQFIQCWASLLLHIQSFFENESLVFLVVYINISFFWVFIVVNFVHSWLVLLFSFFQDVFNINATFSVFFNVRIKI